MPDFKLVLSDPKTGKSVQRELKEDSTKVLFGKKIGDAIKGEVIGLPGFEFVITGGSDYAGFPMRVDITGVGRKKIIDVKGIGVTNKLRKPNPKKKGWRTMDGMRLKKTVAGNTIHAKTAQVNMKCTKKGKEPVFGEETPEQAAKPEKPAKEKKAAAPKKEAPAAEDSDLSDKEEKVLKEAEDIDKEVEKDEEELKKDDAEIEEIEDELKKSNSDVEI